MQTEEKHVELDLTTDSRPDALVRWQHFVEDEGWSCHLIPGVPECPPPVVSPGFLQSQVTDRSHPDSVNITNIII